MFLPVIASLAPLGLLATSVAANPTVVQVRDTFVTLPFARRINVTGTLDLVLRDQARARQFAKQSGTSTSEVTSDVGVTNAGVNYVASVGVGSPATYCGSHRFKPDMVTHTLFLDSLIIDTGSSNTWVGAKRPYVKTKTSVKTSNRVVSIPVTPRLVVQRRLKPMSQAVPYGSGSFSGKRSLVSVTLIVSTFSLRC
jgi:hypothetical protein